MAQDYSALSFMGMYLFLADYVDSTTVPTSGTILSGILDFTPPSEDKETKKYRTLDGDGWETVVPLGQSLGDITVEFLRTGTGDIYVGTAGQSTYSILKNWSRQTTKEGGKAAPKCLIFAKPRGTGYEGTLYYVILKSFSDGKAGENGQEFTVTLTPFGPPVDVQVTKGSDNEWTFAPVSGD